MKIFQIQIRRYDRRDGLSLWHQVKEHANSASVAVARAIKTYLRGLTPKERRDAAKQIEIKCTYVGVETESHDSK